MSKFARQVRYSMGNFANTIAYNVFGNRIQFYYVDVLGLNALVAGILWTVYGVWNMINGPLLGQVSDRTRSRMGRRIPYVWFGAIPLGLSFFLLWTPIPEPPWVLAAYFIGILFIFDALYSLIIICYNALFSEVAPTLRERVDLATIREILATIALLLAFILAPILAEGLGYVWMGILMGSLVAAGYMISVLGVVEKPVGDAEVHQGLWASLGIVLSSRPFRWFSAANIAKEYVWLELAAMLPFWRKYALNIQSPIDIFSWRVSPGNAEAILLGSAILFAIPCLLIWRPLLLRLGYRTTWILAALAFIPGLIMMMLANDFYSGWLSTLLTAPGLAGSMIMPFPVITEVIDDDARNGHGYSREGIFFGMNAGISKLAFPVQGIMFAGVMWFCGYQEGVSDQTPAAINGIRFLIGGSTALACLVVIFSMWHYPLGRQKVGN